jgi:cell division protein FtsZ
MTHNQSENTTPPIGPRTDANAQATGSSAGIKVIGVGGCGCNAVEHLIQSGVMGVESIFAFTKFHKPNMEMPVRCIQLDSRDAWAVESVLHEIVAAISGAQVLFIVAGLGGRTGGSGAHVIASAARKMGIRTFGVVFTPFAFESEKRIERAAASLRLLNETLNMMTVISNDKLLALGGNLSQEAAFSMANDVLKNAVRGMADIAAALPRLMAREDFCQVLRMPGRALVGCASAVGLFRVGIAITRALECPLVADQDLFNAKGVLILLTVAEKALELGEFLHARNVVLAHWPPNVCVVFETVYDNALQDGARVTVMVTGLSNALVSQA